MASKTAFGCLAATRNKRRAAPVGVVNKHTIAALAGEFAGDASSYERLHGLGRCGKTHALGLREVIQRKLKLPPSERYAAYP